MKKSIVSLFLIGILLPFNPLFGASKSSSYGSSSSKSSSYGSSSSKSSSYGSSSSKSSSYGSGSSSNYGSSSSSKSSSYGSGSSSNYGRASSNLNAPSYGNASNTSNILKKVATGAAIGVGAGAVANEIQNSSVKTEQPKPTSDVKKPELSSYEKMKADNIQKNNSVVDNTMKSSYKEPVKSNNTNTVNNTMKSSSYNSYSNNNYSNNNYSNPYKDYSYRKKVYHYDTSVPYGSRYNSYGIGNYYGHSTMDYLPAMMLIYMLSNSNDSSDDYYAKQYYQERQNDVDMRQWREEMEAQSKDNKEIKDLLYRLDNANKPVDYNSSNYSNKIDGLSQQVSKDQKDFSSVSGTEIKPEQSDYTLKDEVLFISK